jgi:hypothetical protein
MRLQEDRGFIWEGVWGVSRGGECWVVNVE